MCSRSQHLVLARVELVPLVVQAALVVQVAPGLLRLVALVAQVVLVVLRLAVLVLVQEAPHPSRDGHPRLPPRLPPCCREKDPRYARTAASDPAFSPPSARSFAASSNLHATFGRSAARPRAARKVHPKLLPQRLCTKLWEALRDTRRPHTPWTPEWPKECHHRELDGPQEVQQLQSPI